MRSTATLTAFVAALLLTTGCSLLVNFDPEGQSCDSNNQCLEGYGCELGKCVKGAPPVVTSPCGNCTAGQKCLETSRTCVPNTCQYTRCPVGSVCNDSAGTPNCRPIVSPALGHPCAEDVECSAGGFANRFCYRGAVQTDDTVGTLRTGVCVERCLPGGAGCLTTGATCRDFPLSIDAGTNVTKLCVPDNTLFSCRGDFDCVDSAFVCTVFDSPSLGPATICDAALVNGAQPQSSCTLSRADGGSLPYCANGLCVTNGGSAKCGVACSPESCASGQSCASVEVTVRQTPRHVPICIPATSHCAACSSDSSCNADAPRCTLFGAGGNFNCLSTCSMSPGTFSSCPVRQTCTAIGDAGLRCLPDIGICP